MQRTHTCGEITAKNNNKTVELAGWTHAVRLHGGLVFVDIRDRYGLTQLVFDSSENKENYNIAQKLNKEDIIKIKGKVRPRKKGFENSKLKTGEIEVLVNKLEILSKSSPLPIDIEEDEVHANEDTRIKYRYLDLRRPSMRNNLITRHKVIKATRDYLDKLNFIEIETPILARSTPEGARDYLVPSRVHQGKLFALPQSPQLFKQLLMISGFDRYMQIVKCFRDEDLRADRQPEFTQIDLEMSFIDEEDIYELIEGLVKDIFKRTKNINLKTPFPRMTYEEATNKYGTDAPDLRFNLELIDITDIAKKSEFKIFKEAPCIKCINAKKCASYSRKDVDKLTEVVKTYDAKGLAFMRLNEDGVLESPITKFFSKELLKKITKITDAKKGDLLLFVADKHFITNTSLGALRLHLAKKLDLIKDEFNFIWVNDFPLLEYDEDEKRHIAVHHPFTSPKDEHIKFLEKDPLKIIAKAYDLTLNGTEIGGGSIRINNIEIQKNIFKTLNISEKEAEEKFGFLLEALKYGAPPHGGFAFGLDRLVAIITGNESIREVIAFPKNKAAYSPLDNSPNKVDKKQLEELDIKLKK